MRHIPLCFQAESQQIKRHLILKSGSLGTLTTLSFQSQNGMPVLLMRARVVSSWYFTTVSKNLRKHGMRAIIVIEQILQNIPGTTEDEAKDENGQGNPLDRVWPLHPNSSSSSSSVSTPPASSSSSTSSIQKTHCRKAFEGQSHGGVTSGCSIKIIIKLAFMNHEATRVLKDF